MANGGAWRGEFCGKLLIFNSFKDIRPDSAARGIADGYSFVLMYIPRECQLIAGIVISDPIYFDYSFLINIYIWVAANSL